MNYLFHHGVKGQKWGVRNGPPYPIEDKVLRKGTRINSVSDKYIDSDSYKNNSKWMYTYRQDEEWDNKVYKGPFAKYLVMYRGARFIKEHQYETVKDLTMPNKKERVEEFKEIYDNRKTHKDTLNDLESVRSQLVQYKIGNEKDQKKYAEIDLKNLKSEEDYKTAYDIFNHAMEANHMYKSTSEYVKNISKKYDAMVDDNNQGVYNDAHDPIIIFRAREALKTIEGDPVKSYLNIDDIIKNYNDVEKDLAKKGIRPKL